MEYSEYGWQIDIRPVQGQPNLAHMAIHWTPNPANETTIANTPPPLSYYGQVTLDSMGGIIKILVDSVNHYKQLVLQTEQAYLLAAETFSALESSTSEELIEAFLYTPENQPTQNTDDPIAKKLMGEQE